MNVRNYSPERTGTYHSQQGLLQNQSREEANQVSIQRGDGEDKKSSPRGAKGSCISKDSPAQPHEGGAEEFSGNEREAHTDSQSSAPDNECAPKTDFRSPKNLAEDQQLALAVQRGGPGCNAATTRLLEKHEGLCVSIAVKHEGHGTELYTILFEEAKLALWDAATRYNPNHESEASLTWFAKERMHKAVWKALIEAVKANGGVNVSDYAQRIITRVKKAQRARAAELNRSLSEAEEYEIQSEILDEKNHHAGTREGIKTALNSEWVSLQKTVGDRGTRYELDAEEAADPAGSTEEQVIAAERAHAVAAARQSMEPANRRVIEGRHPADGGEKLTLQEIADADPGRVSKTAIFKRQPRAEKELKQKLVELGIEGEGTD